MMKTPSLGIRVNPELKASLEKAAIADHRSLSSLVEKILADSMSTPQADRYAWEKAYLAVLGLATSTAAVQERIGNAYMFHLMHIWPENITDPLIQKTLDDIAFRLTQVKPKGNEGSVVATVSEMSDDEAQEIARKIFELHDRISRQYGWQN